MKFSVQEEHALRCLLRICEKYENNEVATIPEISEAEGISQHTIAKILRELRIAGFLSSERGHTGGYVLTKSPDKITVAEVFTAIGGRLFDDDFCKSRSGELDICTHSIDCSIRSLWSLIQTAVDKVITNLTLKDLMANEENLLAKFPPAKGK